MEILVIILLAVIAYMLWRIYRQRENEKIEIADKEADKEFEIEREQERKERFKDYPHLLGKLEGNWLDVFALDAENKLPLLKLAFMLMLPESVKMDLSEGSMKYDNLWGLTEELLEHLEKFHEGSVIEHEIAVCTYWQICATAVGELIKENPEIEGKKLEVEPYTNIKKIVDLFPKKSNHPAKEISFVDEKGVFPRKSKGSVYISGKMKAQGL